MAKLNGIGSIKGLQPILSVGRVVGGKIPQSEEEARTERTNYSHPSSFITKAASQLLAVAAVASKDPLCIGIRVQLLQLDMASKVLMERKNASFRINYRVSRDIYAKS